MASSARQQNARLAELKAQQARKERSRRVLLAGGAVVLVLAVVAAIAVGAKLSNKPAEATPQLATSGPASDSTVKGITGVSAATFDKIGVGSAQPGVIQANASGAPRTTDGRPEVLYLGAEYCPYCASERWSLAVALSRFGSFTGLENTASSSTDANPNTPTVSFKDAKYTSKYLSLVSYETQDRDGKPMQTPPQDVLDYQKKLDPETSIPFVDFGGKAWQKGAVYDGAVLAGKTQDQVAQALGDPNSDIAKAIIGGANVTTAQLCQLTNHQPGDVCSSAGVKAAASAAAAK